MIVKKIPKYERPKIDLTGPDGNAFSILGIAKRWMKKIDPERVEDVIAQMTSGDYIKLVAYFEIHFGSVCDIEMPDDMIEAVQKKIDSIRGTEDIEWNMKQLGFDLNLD